MNPPVRDADPVAQLQALIEDIGIAMLVTHAGESGLHGRPMQTQKLPFDGRLRFLTSEASPKTLEIEDNAEVALVYADSYNQRYVYVTGQARVLSDPLTIGQLWQTAHEPWFPRGRDDPDLRLLEVGVLRALYWIRRSDGDRARIESGTIDFAQHEEGSGRPRTVVAGTDRDAHNTGATSGQPRHRPSH